MGKFAVGIISLVVGLVLGAIGALTVGGGAMAGVGVATGLTTGICMTVEAAEDIGLMTPDQVEEVLARAAENLSSVGGMPEGQQSEIADTSAECKNFMEKLRNQG